VVIDEIHRVQQLFEVMRGIIDDWRGVAWRGVAWRGVAWRGLA